LLNGFGLFVSFFNSLLGLFVCLFSADVEKFYQQCDPGGFLSLFNFLYFKVMNVLREFCYFKVFLMV